MTSTLQGVKLQRQTVMKALDDDEGAFGIAVARFTLGPEDSAWNPDGPTRFRGPLNITYERHHGAVRVRGVAP